MKRILPPWRSDAAGAVALGQAAKRGTITPGKFADIVVLDADPSRNIRNTTGIAFVVKHGRVHALKIIP